MLTAEELKAIADTVGPQASLAIKSELAAYEQKAKDFAIEAAKGSVTKEVFEAYQNTAKEALEKLTTIAEKQGTTLTEIAMKVNTSGATGKSIAETLAESKDELAKVYNQGSGTKTFMLTQNNKGEFVMTPHDTTKAVGPVASISGINGGTAASIFQSIDAASLLRIGGNSSIISQYRNTSWVFDLCNIVNVGWDTPMAMWFEEVAKTGVSATVTEGATKPLVQYGYTLKTATYKKEAMLIGFTEEFSMDFARLQSDIIGKGKIDVTNRINTAVLTNILAAATAYNTGTSYKTARGGAITANYNDYLAIDAMAAQVDNATFGQKANVAIMSTFRNHALSTLMDSQGRFLMPPQILNNLTWVGNPAMAVDDVIVGDLTQYNIMLRGGLLVKIGYNGTDFAQNMFSTVIEQYYFDWISAIRAVAIVKGQTFATVKTAITT